jgi:threonine synthase
VSKNAEAKIRYSVPTGNFGDALAGYFALRMGLPIDKLIVATNKNDILASFFTTGEYKKIDVCHITISPVFYS